MIEAVAIELAAKLRRTSLTSYWHLLHLGPGNSWDRGTNCYVMVWQSWLTGEIVALASAKECEAFALRMEEGIA